jgi:hypothetical protein
MMGLPGGDSAEERAAPGANAAIVGGSESTLNPAVVQAVAHRHSHGSPTGRAGPSAGPAACSLQIGAADAEYAADVARASPESTACRAMA